VVWNDTVFTDVVEHPELGRICPAPYFLTGGHATEGFMLARGRGFTPGMDCDPVSTEDVTATVLDLLDVAKPDHVEGSSQVEPREIQV